MKRFAASFVLTIIMLFVVCSSVLAAPNWVTVVDTPKTTFQYDKETVVFLGTDGDRSVDFWMRIVDKEKPGAYGLVHYVVKEAGLTYLKKEHNVYSAAGDVISSSDSTSKGWAPLPAESPAGRIARSLFGDRASQPVAQPAAPAAPAVTVDPQEVKKALEEDRIKLKDSDGYRSYSVRARQGAHWFSSETDQFFFNLNYNPNNNKSTTLKVDIRLSGTGASMKQAVDVVVDGRPWHLAPPIAENSSGSYGNIYFEMTFNMPEALVQALATTKGPVSVRWKQKIGIWEDKEFILQDKSLRDIQLMYLGCK